MCSRTHRHSTAARVPLKPNSRSPLCPAASISSQQEKAQAPWMDFLSCALESHHALWSFLYHQTPSPCRTVHIPFPFPKPPPAPFIVVSYFPSPLGSQPVSDPLSLPMCPLTQLCPTPQTISFPRHPGPSMCAGHMLSSSCSNMTRNSTGSGPPVLKVRDLGGLDWLPPLLGVLGKTAANTASEAESSPQMLRVSLHPPLWSL